jgi:hypothetical protein
MTAVPVSGAEPSRSGTIPETSRARPLWLRWLLVPAGLVATWGWLSFSPGLIESITFSSDVQAVALFYLILFAPLIALGALLGLVGGVRVFRTGVAPAVYGGLGLAMGCLGLGAAALLAWLNAGFADGVGGQLSVGMLGMGVGLTLIQAGAEEVLVRGWLQAQLDGLVGALAAIVLAAVLFAGLHLAAGPVAVHSLLNMVLAGCLFGALAWRSGGIVAPVAAHFAWNLTEDVGLGLVPNPGLGPFGALRDFELIGPVFWGGGDEGLNASMGTTIVLLALILPLLARGGVRRSA